MWATASPGLPGKFDLQVYLQGSDSEMYVCVVHVSTALRNGKCVHVYMVNDSMEHISSWKAAVFSDLQEIP